MKVMQSKLFFPLVALVVWIAMIVLFGLFSHFSLEGFGLLVYGLCMGIYDSVDEKAPVNRRRKLIAGAVGLVFACVSLINAFYLESQGLFFKGFVAAFSLAMAYVFAKMIRETARKK